MGLVYFMPTDQTSYVFVDAGYLHRVLHDKLYPFLGTPVDMRLDHLLMSYTARRAFYYECIDEERKSGETEVAFKERVQRQTEALERINSLPGFFVRLGSLRGVGARRRQKEIDVLLAVDMLTHSHNRNMSRAILIAGDLDFKPVVEALVQQGTLVTVVSDLQSTSNDLAAAADVHQPLDLRTLWKLTSGPRDASLIHLFPTEFPSNQQPTSAPIRTGTLDGKEVSLFHESGIFKVVLPVSLKTMLSVNWKHGDQAKLEQFINVEFGTVAWS
jgi:uncharacterized LabA/DUF88 family protein